MAFQISMEWLPICLVAIILIPFILIAIPKKEDEEMADGKTEKLVRFDKDTPTGKGCYNCAFMNTSDAEFPCHPCMEGTTNENSQVPINWKPGKNYLTKGGK